MARLWNTASVLLLLVVEALNACEIEGTAVESQRDLQRQESLVEKAVLEADFVATATVSEIGGARRRNGEKTRLVQFKIWRWFKGENSVEGTLVELSANLDTLNVVCLPSDKFYEDQVVEGEKLIVYGKDGKVLRARSEKREIGELSYGREIELLARSVGA